MSWMTVKLSDVSAVQEPIPEGEYTFQLLGAELDQFGRIVCRGTVVGGEEAGKGLRFSYPSPDEQSWATMVLKRLEIALGLEQDETEGEDVVAFLNRAVAAGSQFRGAVKHTQKFAEGSETPVTYANLNLFSVTPAG